MPFHETDSSAYEDIIKWLIKKHEYSLNSAIRHPSTQVINILIYNTVFLYFILLHNTNINYYYSE